ncbi:AMP-binding protein [Pelagibaculum spongiae]|uniref:AMP-dependent synthetase/ligase domain-containing protein n=1 Tax=Pelagibaculum spongiae TaxID=2080658 RepID=A0A2V1GWJ6_9GAMM|nr:AMP-binding protein [Pelagibaculum spongiae]PVZ65399.1 hypothetical protein DC094_18120 [Pelagibaculum spongiae]
MSVISNNGIYQQNTSLIDQLIGDDHIHKVDHRVALQSADQQLSYFQLQQRIYSLASQLKTLQIKVVALQLENNVDWVITDLACLAANICCVPIPVFFTEQQQQHCIKSANADLLISNQIDKNNITLAGLTQSSAIHLNQQSININNTLPEDCSKVTFTSGSTGQPKGVCLTQKTMLQTLLAVQKATEATQARKHLCLLPLATLLENLTGLWLTLLNRGTIVLVDSKNLGFSGAKLQQPQLLLASISQAQPHSIILLPQLLGLLLQAHSKLNDKSHTPWKLPDSLQFMAIGGAKTPVTWLDAAQQLNWPVFEGYGLSEAGSVVCLNQPQQKKNGTVGQALSHVKLSVADDGELLLKGHYAQHYLIQNPTQSLTQDSQLQSTDQQDGWLKTGDIASIDSQGFISIEGRKSNLLITQLGRNISPEWPESLLNAQSSIAQAMVIGDHQPFLAGLIVAFADASPQQLQLAIDQVNQQLPDYAKIQQWLIVAPFSIGNGQLTDNGRLKRAAINHQHAELIEALYQPNTQKTYSA